MIADLQVKNTTQDLLKQGGTLTKIKTFRGIRLASKRFTKRKSVKAAIPFLG
jgi:hypothetical protein